MHTSTTSTILLFPLNATMADLTSSTVGQSGSRVAGLCRIVAPNIVHFLNQKWEFIGDKKSLATALQNITLIPTDILVDGISSRRPSVAQIMSWTADRKTTREEDQAYSLLGLLGVHMPMLCGEGKNAFRRLQEEIIRRFNDQSIFAWGHTWRSGWSNSLLADYPSCFRDCYNVVKMEPGDFMDTLRNDVPADELLKMPDNRLRTFSITNAGIEIWLPLARCSGSTSLFRAKLACRSESWTPVTIFLVCFNPTILDILVLKHFTAQSSIFRGSFFPTLITQTMAISRSKWMSGHYLLMVSRSTVSIRTIWSFQVIRLPCRMSTTVPSSSTTTPKVTLASQLHFITVLVNIW